MQCTLRSWCTAPRTLPLRLSRGWQLAPCVCNVGTARWALGAVRQRAEARQCAETGHGPPGATWRHPGPGSGSGLSGRWLSGVGRLQRQPHRFPRVGPGTEPGVAASGTSLRAAPRRPALPLGPGRPGHHTLTAATSTGAPSLFWNGPPRPLADRPRPAFWLNAPPPGPGTLPLTSRPSPHLANWATPNSSQVLSRPRIPWGFLQC